MTQIAIRDATPEDRGAILGLNAASVHFLSPLDQERLAILSAQTCYFRVADRAGEVVGFLMAFREGSTYDSPNYRWFAERYDRFIYIDRVVIREDVRGKGLGAAFYRELEERVRLANVPWLTAEVDLVPPNMTSLTFHDKFGFMEVGQQEVGSEGKVVSLRARRVGTG